MRITKKALDAATKAYYEGPLGYVWSEFSPIERRETLGFWREDMHVIIEAALQHIIKDGK